jgi:hypothetical protein
MQPDPRPTGNDPLTGPSLEIAPEVARALGAATVMRLRADATLDEYVCCICDDAGSAQPPGSASVIAAKYTSGITYVRLAHPDCSPSAVLTLLGDLRLRHHRLRGACWLRPRDTGTVDAVLLISNDVRAWPRRLARLAVDHNTRALVQAGFTPLHDLNDDPPLAAGLTAVVNQGDTSGRASIHISHPEGIVFDGNLDAPEGWHDAAHASGRLVVITATPLATSTPAAVAVAVHAGRVIAATAALTAHAEHPQEFSHEKYRRSA